MNLFILIIEYRFLFFGPVVMYPHNEWPIGTRLDLSPRRRNSTPDNHSHIHPLLHLIEHHPST